MSAWRRLWLGPVLALGVALLAAVPGGPAAWALTAHGLARGQLWQLWTGQMVHWGALHAAADALALLATALVAQPLFGGLRLLGALALAAPALAGAVRWLEPQLDPYRGASGLVLMLGGCAWLGLWRARRAGRSWLLVLAVVLLLKLGWEFHVSMRGLGAAGLGLPAGVQVAWSAHAAGLLLGLCCGAALPLRPSWVAADDAGGTPDRPDSRA